MLSGADRYLRFSTTLGHLVRRIAIHRMTGDDWLGVHLDSVAYVQRAVAANFPIAASVEKLFVSVAKSASAYLSSHGRSLPVIEPGETINHRN